MSAAAAHMQETGDIAIHARGLTKRFGDLVAVDGVDLTVPRAHVYGFLGPNGSGKTTTIRMLCGLLDHDAGEVDVLGLCVPEQAETLRRRIGYMTQRFSLFGDLSVRENLEFMAAAQGVPKTKARSRIDTLIEQYHFADRQKQLFELADAGTTLLVSTHYMDEAERCHRLAILDRGVLVADGSPAELTAKLHGRTVEVRAEQPRRAQKALLDVPGVVSVAQIGNALRVLVREDGDADARVRDALDADDQRATVEAVPPNLEDVFVDATRGGETHRELHPEQREGGA